MARAPAFAKHATLIKTLVSFDGPQVALFQTDRDRSMIAVACDKVGYRYAMFCVEISQDTLVRYLENRIDLNYVFRRKESVTRYYFIDWYLLQGRDIELFIASEDDIADNHIYPDPGFFARDHTVEYGVPRVTNSVPRSYAIDGKWYAPDFSRFYNKLSDVYAFAILSSPTIRDKLGGKDRQLMKESISSYAWKGGGSYISFYNQLFASISSLNPLDVAKIQYASPGTIEVSGGEQPLNEVNELIHIFSFDSAGLKKRYLEIDRLMQREGMKKAGKDHSFFSKSVEDYALETTRRFARDLAIVDTDGLLDVCDNNVPVFIKIVLSYYRRGRDLHKFYAEGRISLPERRFSILTSGQSQRLP